MSSSNLPSQRVRANTDPEPSLPSLDVHVPKRRKTITLLDSSDYEKNTADAYHVKVELAEAPVVPPPMITDHTHITSNFVEHAISYAKSRLPRDITPRIATLLRDYLDLAEKVKARHDLIDKVCLYQCHKTLHSEAFLSRKPSEEELEQKAALRELSTLRYYLQYGDYVADHCHDFRYKASRLQGKDLRFFEDRIPWTDVQALIDEEKRAVSEWHANSQKGPVPPKPTQDAIYRACEKSDLDYHQVLYSIEWYAQRNWRAHNGVGRMISDCRFEELGNRIYWDIQDIPTIFGEEDQAKMKAVLEGVANRYFFEVKMEGSILNDHAIGLASARQKAELTKAQKARGGDQSISGPLTVGQQRRVTQHEQRQSVQDERSANSHSTEWLDGANEDIGIGDLE